MLYCYVFTDTGQNNLKKLKKLLTVTGFFILNGFVDQS